MTKRIRKITAAIVVALGLLLAGSVPAQADGLPTPPSICEPWLIDASQTAAQDHNETVVKFLSLLDAQEARIADLSDQARYLRAKLHRRTVRVHRQARLIRHLRAELRRERASH